MTHPSGSARVLSASSFPLSIPRESGAETGTASAYVCACIYAHASAHLVDQLERASGGGGTVPIFSIRSYVGRDVYGVILPLPVFSTFSTPLHFGRVRKPSSLLGARIGLCT